MTPQEIEDFKAIKGDLRKIIEPHVMIALEVLGSFESGDIQINLNGEKAASVNRVEFSKLVNLYESLGGFSVESGIFRQTKPKKSLVMRWLESRFGWLIYYLLGFVAGLWIGLS